MGFGRITVRRTGTYNTRLRLIKVYDIIIEL